MNQKVVATIGLFAIFIAGIGSYFIVGQQRQSPEQAEMPRIETPADVNQVEFSLPDLTGTMRDQSEWQGKAQLINFWAINLQVVSIN